jgi:hypothetical protein
MRVEALTMCGTALFAGSSYNGVFRSTDNGETWNAANSGLSNTCVFSRTGRFSQSSFRHPAF